MGAVLGDDVLEAGPGDLVFKPRGEWHTFWNAGDVPCRILEIIAPAGFERFFAELADLGGVARSNPAVLGDLCARYALEMDPASVPALIERFGVVFPAEPLRRRGARRFWASEGEVPCLDSAEAVQIRSRFRHYW